MISLIDNLPLLEFGNGGVFAFRREWLRLNLLQAAERAGYRDWWLADHVAASITNYLLSQYEAPVLPAAELRDSVAQVLSSIGYAEIGRQFSPTRPVREISLLEVATESGKNELVFFHHLRQAIDREIQGSANAIRLVHLLPAVKFMLGVKLFTEECGLFREEIVSYSRSTVTSHMSIIKLNVLIC